MTVARCSADDLNDCRESVLVNCVGTAPQRLAAVTRSVQRHKLAIVTDADAADKFAGYGPTLSLPASYGRLHAFCRDASPRKANRSKPSVRLNNNDACAVPRLGDCKSAAAVEDLTNLLGESCGQERLLKEVCFGLEDPVPHDGIVRVARHEQ